MAVTQKELMEKFKPVECHTLNDIKMALKPFFSDTGNKEVTLSCNINWSESGQSGTDKVTGTSVDVSLRQLLLDGMEVVKNRSEAYGKMKEAQKIAKESGVNMGLCDDIWDVNKCRFNVDALIERKLGGKRIGVRVRWNIQEGIYEFDPYNSKLFKVE